MFVPDDACDEDRPTVPPLGGRRKSSEHVPQKLSAYIRHIHRTKEKTWVVGRIDSDY